MSIGVAVAIGLALVVGAWIWYTYRWAGVPDYNVAPIEIQREMWEDSERIRDEAEARARARFVTLPAFESAPLCIHCGEATAGAQTVHCPMCLLYGYGNPHFHRTCCRCGFRWHEKTLCAPGSEPGA